MFIQSDLHEKWRFVCKIWWTWWFQVFAFCLYPIDDLIAMNHYFFFFILIRTKRASVLFTSSSFFFFINKYRSAPKISHVIVWRNSTQFKSLNLTIRTIPSIIETSYQLENDFRINWPLNTKTYNYVRSERNHY